METTIELDHLSSKEFKSELRVQMGQDIQVLLSPYKNKDIGIRLLSEKTGISEKTLKRIIKQESDPHSVTIQRFYEYYFKINVDQNQYNAIQLQLQQELNKSVQQNKQRVDQDLEKLLATNKVFRDIFLFTRAAPISRVWVLENYGLYGMEMVALMLKEDLVVEKEKGIYCEGPVSVTKGPATLKTIIEDLITHHVTPENLQEYGKNMAFYMIEGVNEKTLNDVLTLTDQYKKSLAKLIFSPSSKGDKRIFVTSVVDELKEKDGKEKTGRIH